MGLPRPSTTGLGGSPGERGIGIRPLMDASQDTIVSGKGLQIRSAGNGSNLHVERRPSTAPLMLRGYLGEFFLMSSSKDGSDHEWKRTIFLLAKKYAGGHLKSAKLLENNHILQNNNNDNENNRVPSSCLPPHLSLKRSCASLCQHMMCSSS